MHFNEEISLFQITHDLEEKSFDNSYIGISAEIAAVNLKCINYEDPTDDKCNGGWFFRKVDAEIPSPNNRFLIYPALTITCTGKTHGLIVRIFL